MKDEERAARFEWFHQLAKLEPDHLAEQATRENQAAFNEFVAVNLLGHRAPEGQSGEEFANQVLALRQNESQWNMALSSALIEADDLFQANESFKATSLLESFASRCPWLLFQEVALNQSSHYKPR